VEVVLLVPTLLFGMENHWTKRKEIAGLMLTVKVVVAVMT
jgi:hypothetical protein